MFKFWVENIARPRIRYQEAAPTWSAWSDKTSDVSQLDLHGTSSIGLNRTRNLIQTAVIIATNPNYPTIDFSGWAAYPQDLKDIAIKWIVVPYALRVPAITDAEDQENWLDIAEGTKQGRVEIVEKMRLFVSEELRKEVLTKTQLDEFWDDTFLLFNSYIGANSPDFKTWLITIFSSKTYWTQVLENGLLSIYNGEY